MSTALPDHEKSLSRLAAERLIDSVNDNGEGDVFRALQSSVRPRMSRRTLGEIWSRDETIRMLAPRATATAIGATPIEVGPAGRYPLPGDAPVRARRLLDFCDLQPTDASAIRYLRETARSDDAAPVPFGDTSPAVNAETFEQFDVEVETIPVYVTALRSQMMSAPVLQQVLETRLAGSVRGQVEYQVIQGDGSSPNLPGILGVTSIGSVSRATSETRYAAAVRGIEAVRSTLGDEPNAVLVHPTDYGLMLGETDGDSSLIVSGVERVAQTITSIPVVVSPAAPSGHALVGAFDLGATVWIREGIDAAVSDDHADYFTRQLLLIQSLLRVALTVEVGRAFCQVNF